MGLLVSIGAACNSSDDATDEDASEPASSGELVLTSPAFADGGKIPIRFTCDGADTSPPLAWTGIPEDAVELVLIVDDPDAPEGTFTHWVAYRIFAEATSIPEEGDANLINGVNSFGDASWGGPCPPEGDGPHTYTFLLQALGEPIALDPGASLGDVEAGISGAVLDSAVLTGTYER